MNPIALGHPFVCAFALAILCSNALAQVGPTITLDQTCSYFGENMPQSVVTFDSDEEAEQVIRSIVRASGLAPNFDIRAGGVPNAAAVVQQGRRFILYDQYFIRKLTQSAGTRWAAVSVMAHEVGHHLNGHTLVAGGSRPNLELEADLFSGFVLQKLGASLDDSRKAMEVFGSPTGSSTHPAKNDRLAAITRGWTQSCEKDTACKAASAPRESPQPTPETKQPTRPAPEPDREPDRRTGRDSCEYANDGECDEPDLCKPGTDTTDCRGSRSTRPSQSSRNLYCCDGYGRKWCPMTVSMPLGSQCFCSGVPGSGFVCQ